MKRRTILLAGGTVMLGTIAGCTGSDDDDEGAQTTTATEEPAPTQQTQTTSAGAETTSEAETATNEEKTTTAQEDSGTPTAEDTETTTEEDSEDVLFGTIYTMPDNYRIEAEFSDPDSGESGTMTGKYNGSNYYNRIETDSSDDYFEIYHIEGDDYVVLNGAQCFLNPGSSVKPDSGTEGDADEYGEKPDADLQPSGTTEIEGETVYVFEVTGEDVEGKWILYVSVSTGYLRRVETDNAIVDFYDWGNVDPIEKPDMECQG